MTAHHLDRAVEQLARAQHFVLNHDQAAGLAVTDDMIQMRLANGQWRRLDHAVYALAAGPPTWRQTLMAATLAEPHAVVSHQAAAGLHQLANYGHPPAEISVPPRANARGRLAVVHRMKTSPATVVDAIPVTTVASTLFDLASTASRPRLRRAVIDALERSLVEPPELLARLDALSGSRRRGLPVMRELLDELIGLADLDASALEQLLHEVLADPRIPPWQAEAPFPWDPEGASRVDAFVVAWRLIIEADGRRWHTRMDDFARDRARDNAAVAHGYRVLRFTWDDLINPNAALPMILDVGRQAHDLVA